MDLAKDDIIRRSWFYERTDRPDLVLQGYVEQLGANLGFPRSLALTSFLPPDGGGLWREDFPRIQDSLRVKNFLNLSL